MVGIDRHGLLRSYHRHETELIGFLTNRLRCAATAADLAHDLYVRVLHGQHPERVRNPRAYLFRMAANLASDHQRDEARRREIETECQRLLWPGSDLRTPERKAVARNDLTALQSAVAELPARTRYIFYQNRFRGVRQADIAAELGVSTTTVEKHMRRVMSALAEASGASSGSRAP